MSKEYKPSPLPYERVGRWIKDAEGRTVCSMETAFHGKDAVTADVIVAVVNSHATLTADLARVTAERDRLRTIVEMMTENASDVRVFLPDAMRKWFDPMTAKATEALKATT